MPLMFVKAVKTVAGACVVGEAAAFVTNDRIQAVGWMLAGVATWVLHAIWSFKRERRRSRDDDRDSDRRNLVLDALAKKYDECIKSNQPFPWPDLVPLLVGHRRDGDEAEGGAEHAVQS